MNKSVILHLKKQLAVLLCIATILTFFSSCRNESLKTVKLRISTVPSGMDPQISIGTDAENIINNCFEGLVRIDKNGNVISGVAKDWTISEDKLTYRFNLNPKATWYLPSKLEDLLGENYADSFDTRVTAEDFVFAFQRAVDPATGAPFANILSVIDNAEKILNGKASPDTLSVYAENDTTLVIKLSHPIENFLSVLASPICMPCNQKFFEATRGRYGLEAKLIMCNGPYYLGNMNADSGITLYDNESYEGKYKPLANVVRFITVADSAESETTTSDSEETTVPPKVNNIDLLTLDEGGLDAAVVDKKDAEKLDNTFEIQKYKNTIKAICFNSSDTFVSNRNIRLAMAYSTNTAELCGNNASAEGAIPSCCYLSPGVSYRAGSNIIAPPAYNLNTAADYFKRASDEHADSGTSSKLQITATLVCLKDDENSIKKMLQDWQKVFGVTLSVTIKSYDSQTELDSVISRGNYSIAYTNIEASEFLASDFLNRFYSGNGKNIIKLDNAKYNSLVDTVYSAKTQAELLNACKTAETYLVKESYILPVYASDSYLAIRKTASGLSVRPSGTIYALYSE